ncbi:Flp family type IVb pilin [Parerythrobacter aurantius]|uniref:Flp family type IVb pilin n=1 Tax=Parerythrobacter aurantius TaxID=3127706 RepID=UPI003246ADC5
MLKLIKKLLDDRSGATAVEYGLILAMVFLAMVGAVASVGNATSNVWNTVTNTSSAAMSQAGSV